jgi:hypothetical protein
MRRRLGWAVAFALAAVGAFAPIPARWVERWYSQGAYRSLQRVVTHSSNLVPFSLFDGLCVAAMVLVAVAAYRSLRRHGWRRGALRLAGLLARAAALVYIVFLATWGLNYRRVPLLKKLAFEEGRVTTASAEALAVQTVLSLNRLYAEAHRSPASVSVATTFHDVDRALQGSRAIVEGKPKPTLLGGYFHAAAISGMTDPFFLETMIAPDLLDVERPFVLAHEWAHLAGYADESEANYVAWLTCLRGDAGAQYSAWLVILGTVQSHLPRHGAPALDPGPQGDLLAMRYRYRRTSPLLRAAARESYDKYLKANRVKRGIDSYEEVLQLILGTALDSGGNPRLR